MEPFIAEIKLFAGNFAPRGWAFCEGQLLPISQNQALFSLVGTIWGGDGRTTFGLPDLRGRVPVGAGNGAGLGTIANGQRFGRDQVQLTEANMPAHNHTSELHAEAGLANSPKPDGNMLAVPGGTSLFKAPNPNDNKIMAKESIVVGNAGGNQPFDNHQPSLGMHYIIALQGVFPARS